MNNSEKIDNRNDIVIILTIVLGLLGGALFYLYSRTVLGPFFLSLGTTALIFRFLGGAQAHYRGKKIVLAGAGALFFIIFKFGLPQNDYYTKTDIKDNTTLSLDEDPIYIFDSNGNNKEVKGNIKLNDVDIKLVTIGQNEKIVFDKNLDLEVDENKKRINIIDTSGNTFGYTKEEDIKNILNVENVKLEIKDYKITKFDRSNLKKKYVNFDFSIEVINFTGDESTIFKVTTKNGKTFLKELSNKQCYVFELDNKAYIIGIAMIDFGSGKGKPFSYITVSRIEKIW